MTSMSYILSCLRIYHKYYRAESSIDFFNRPFYSTCYMNRRSLPQISNALNAYVNRGEDVYSKRSIELIQLVCVGS